MKKATYGFTLLELLIAIAIFGLLSSACFQLFRSVSRASEVTASIWQETDAMQRTMLLLRKDFSQLADRPIRNEYGDYEAALIVDRNATIQYTRQGWRNFTGAKRSDLQRVRYQFDGQTLRRDYWDVLDRAQDSRSREQIVNDNLTGFSIRLAG